MAGSQAAHCFSGEASTGLRSQPRRMLAQALEPDRDADADAAAAEALLRLKDKQQVRVT